MIAIQLVYILALENLAKKKAPQKKMQTTYPLKIQAIRSKGQQPRFYVSFPLALAAAIGLEPGESVQWELLDRGELHLLRETTPAPSTRRRASKQ
jgi:hypothetical protein